MKTYTVKILTPGQMIIHRGKRARTPVTYKNVTETELMFFQSQCRRLMLEYETVDNESIELSTKVQKVYMEEEDKDIKIERLGEEKEPSSILEKLISESE